MSNKIVTNIAHFLSFVFSPLLMPTYGMVLALWCSVLTFVPVPVKWHLVGFIFALTAVLPALVIAFMKWRGYVSDFGLNIRRERPVPYCVVCLSYLVCAWVLRNGGFPSWLSLFMCGASLATFISLVVNTWWKISAHMAAMGGIVGLVIRIAIEHATIGNPLTLLLWTVAAVGLVGASRVWLGRHTPAQVVAGAFNGALSVLLISSL